MPHDGSGEAEEASGLQYFQTKYPQPPDKSQSQPWLGLTRDMEPPPDHGETSYHGSGRLAGRKALITGGDSGMGRVAASAYAREGADVAINDFPTEEPDARDVTALIEAEGRKASLPFECRVRRRQWGNPDRGVVRGIGSNGLGWLDRATGFPEICLHRKLGTWLTNVRGTPQ